MTEFKRINYHWRKIQTARTELEKQQEYTRSLSERATIQEEAYNLALRQFNRDATLFEEGVISASNLEESRSDMLTERNKRQEIISLMAENNISIARTEDQIVDLELKQQEEQVRQHLCPGRSLQQPESLHHLLGAELPAGGTSEWDGHLYEVLE